MKRSEYSNLASSVRTSILFVLLCVSMAIEGTGQAKTRALQSTAGPLPALAETLRKNFGDKVEAVSVKKPFYVTGDFNGDGAQDLAVVVRIKGSRSDLPKDVRILNPFEPGGKIVFPTNPATEKKYALVIVHSWKAAQPAAKLLLIGESPILILENSRPVSGPESGSMELLSKRGRRPKGQSFPPTAKGDVILMVTEVGGDSRLYWNGRTYRWEDSPED
jgi:hypothetical protein